MKICLDCQKEINVPLMKRGGGEICPKCYGKIVNPQEFFLSAVKELNEKGYYVASCSPGSIGTLSKESSITFDECIDSLPSLPNDCYVKVIGIEGERAIKLIYEFVDCETPLSVLRNFINIYTWTVGLPAVGTNEYFNTCKTCYISNMGG